MSIYKFIFRIVTQQREHIKDPYNKNTIFKKNIMVVLNENGEYKMVRGIN